MVVGMSDMGTLEEELEKPIKIIVFPVERSLMKDFLFFFLRNNIYFWWAVSIVYVLGNAEHFTNVKKKKNPHQSLYVFRLGGTASWENTE